MVENTDPGWLIDLAAAMSDTEGFRLPPFSPIQAGYTYLGQVISHDIVPPTNAAVPARKVTPSLNLDSIYGGPGELGRYTDSDGYFLPGHKNRDLKREDSGKALIPEPRNDDNIIVAQMHVLWQRVHNALLSGGFGNNATEVQKLVIQLFQLIVVEDFLKQILAPSVYKKCVFKSTNYTGFKLGIMPAEFSLAGFRFGHSMVRPGYTLNDSESPALGELFLSGQPVPEKFFIDWSRFFSSDALQAQFANRIDSFITPVMLKVPHQDDRSIEINIIRANLRAGFKANLPSGLEYMMNIRQELNGNHAPPRKLGLIPLGGRRTSALGMRFDKLPLWPYVLLEAEVHHLGSHLGTLGSLIVAEAVRNAMMHSEVSVYRQGRYRFKSALRRMGRLGEQLAKVSESGVQADPYNRRICMQHVLQLLTTLEQKYAGNR